MNILGISAFYHDSAAALVRDGEMVAGAHEERFTRRRHDPDFPSKAVEYCLAEGGIGIDDIGLIVGIFFVFCVLWFTVRGLCFFAVLLWFNARGDVFKILLWFNVRGGTFLWSSGVRGTRLYQLE